MPRQTKTHISEGAANASSTAGTAQGRYEQLAIDREPYLKRGRTSAALTIPALLPQEGHTGTTDLPQPWQSLGAKGVNNLASKIMLILFPPGAPSFRLATDEFTMNRLLSDAQGGGESPEDLKAEIDEAFAKVERAVTARLEARGGRMQLFEAARHLLVIGNVLQQTLPDERLKLHRLDRFVVKRDRSGTVMEILVKEPVDRTTLDPDVLALVNEAMTAKMEGADKKDVDIYTWIRRVGKRWVSHQEVFGKVIPKSAATYPIDKSPWAPLRLTAVDGEDYGRGFVEEYIGDLSSYDGLMQTLIEGSAVSARIIPLVNPGGVTQIKDIVEARNGEPVEGNAQDVTFLKVDKQADLSVAKATADDLKRELQQAFFLLAGVQRNAERVTAEEIRLIAQELEIPLGGFYPTLGMEWQHPMFSRFLFQMQRRKELPDIPEGVVSLHIVTGVSGLGRSTELNRYDLWLAGGHELFGADVMAEYVPVGAYLQKRATALSIDVSGMLRSEEDVQEKRQQAQTMELAKSSIGPAAKMAESQMTQPAPQ